MSDYTYTVAAIYQFARLEDYVELRSPLLNIMLDEDIRGTLLLATEGINGTIAGTADGIARLIAWLRQDPRLANLKYKTSRHSEQPFLRSKVKLKKEIVTMGIEGIDPLETVGTYVDPKDWNALIRDPDVTLIDTRNDYEVQIGSFQGALNPSTGSFREFPNYLSEHLDPTVHKKVAMFCTGGIRCEKSTAYLVRQGFEGVYHLNGGILQYLEDVPQAQSLWYGECFVFDNRVTVDHRLQRGQYEQCHACRRPITAADMASADYQPGVSCPHCTEQTSASQRQRFNERQRQMQLARQRHEQHIGAGTEPVRARRKAAKLAHKARQRAQDHAARSLKGTK